MSGRAGAALGVALFAASFALGVALIGRWVPPPSEPLIEAKLAQLEAHLDEYDTLFFGSSRVFRGIIPRVFDREMAVRGHPTRSYNMGLVALRPHEGNRLLRRVLSLRPPRLRFAFVDLMEWDPRIEPANRFSRRAIAWHDWTETRSALRSTWLSDLSPAAKLDLLSTHLLHWAALRLRVGRVAAEARAGPPAGDEALLRSIERTRGFVPFFPRDYEAGMTAVNRREFEASLDGYREAVAGLARANADRVSLEGWNVAATRAQVARIREAGVVPIHVLPPVGEPTPRPYRIAEAGLVPVLLAFGDPGRYPELFEEESRFDARHLNGRGAKLFSLVLAERFADWLDVH